MNSSREVIVVLAAMGLELKPLARALGAGRTVIAEDIRSFRASLGHIEVVMATTGIGAGAGEVAERILSLCQARAVLSTGTAGGLDPVLRTGDGIASPRVHHYGVPDLPPETADPLLSEGAENVLQYDAVTVAEAVETPAQKKALHDETQAGICEMESYHVMQAARSAGVPGLTLRVVSDTSRDRLPRFNRFVRNGAVDKIRMAEHFTLHPDEARYFAALTRATALASRRLPEIIIPFLEAMPSKKK